MDQKRLVCEGRGLSKVKYAVQNSQECFLARDGGVFIAHTPKTSRWKDSAHLAVRPQCKSRSDRQRGNDYFQIKFSTVGGGGGLTGPGGSQTTGYTGVGGLTGHPWRSDHLGTGAGGLTGPGGGQTASTYFSRQKSISSDKIFQGFQQIQI
jgi:hypothetical protein